MPGDVFLTVGTTRFEALIRAADSDEVAEALTHHGYRRLIMQIGTGTYQPRCLVPHGTSARHATGLEVNLFVHILQPRHQTSRIDDVMNHGACQRELQGWDLLAGILKAWP